MESEGALNIDTAENGGSTEDRPQSDFLELRAEAARVAAGVKLLRWAIVLSLATNLLSQVVMYPVLGLLEIATPLWIAGCLVFDLPRWAIALLALVGVLGILRIRSWPVHRWLIVALVVYLGWQAVMIPVWSVSWAVAVGLENRTLGNSIELLGTASWVPISLLYFVALVASHCLATAVAVHFDRSLIGRAHLAWLCWVGGMLQSTTCVFFAVSAVLRATALPGDYQDLIRLHELQLMILTVPRFIWILWLLVVSFPIGRRLKRFVKLHHCPRCDYDLRERVDAGCPECGWGRGEQPVTTT